MSPPDSESPPFGLKKISPRELGMIEEQVIHSVNRMISSQESAIAAYEARGGPEELRKDIERIRAFNSALSEWMREFLIERSKPHTPEKTFSLIEKLQKMHRAYGEMRWAAARQ
jgi:hypothetical protein